MVHGGDGGGGGEDLCDFETHQGFLDGLQTGVT